MDTLIKGKKSIQLLDKPIKRAKEDSIPDAKKPIKKAPLTFKNKEDYIGDTNEKMHGSDDSTSETDGFVRNMGKEHKNGEDEE